MILLPTEIGCTDVSAFGGKGLQLLSKNIGKLLSGYSQAINKQQNTTGSLFQQKTKSKDIQLVFPQLISDLPRRHYLINVIQYLHLNPVRAKLVNTAEEWPYSSHLDYCGKRNGSLCNKDLLFALTHGEGFTN